MSKFIQNHLADKGYELIALPKADIAPLQLLIQQQKALSAYGDSLLALFEPDEAGLPVRQTATADFAGGQLLSADASAGIKLLSGLFSALKLNGSKLEASLSSAAGLELSFSYTDITEEKVSRMALDNFIAGAIPQKASFQRSLELLKDGELYVITSVLKSAKVEVSLSSAKSTAAELVTAVEGIADLNAQLKRAGSHGFSLSAPAGQPLAFAFQAAKILYDKPRWFQFWNRKEAGFRIKDQSGMVLKAPEDFPISPLRTEAGVVDI
jgi:hypothetical protein